MTFAPGWSKGPKVKRSTSPQVHNRNQTKKEKDKESQHANKHREIQSLNWLLKLLGATSLLL